MPLWRRWSLPGARCAVGDRSAVPFCAVGDHFWVSRVPSVVASRRHLCHRRSLPSAFCAVGGRFGAPFVWWSLLDALCAVGGHFRAPFWRHNVTKATCNCAQM